MFTTMNGLIEDRLLELPTEITDLIKFQPEGWKQEMKLWIRDPREVLSVGFLACYLVLNIHNLPWKSNLPTLKPLEALILKVHNSWSPVEIDRENPQLPALLSEYSLAHFIEEQEVTPSQLLEKSLANAQSLLGDKSTPAQKSEDQLT